MGPPDIFIDVSQLSRYYGDLCAVDELSFQVKKGEVLGFLGPNGAGKSTTMQMITGNLAPTSGQIIINGIDILDHPKQAKAHIGFLAEQPPLYKDLSVDEYLIYCARLNRIEKPAIKAALDRAKQRCGLTDVGERIIGHLSKGYQQRAGIAQAIIHSPAVVILDEPTVGLDPIQIREIRLLIRDLGDDHSVILSTHILPEVQATCDVVQIINKGKLVLNTPVSEIDQQISDASLLIALQNAPSIDELGKALDINKVEQISDQRFRLHFRAPQNPTPVIVPLSVERNWGLLELIPEQRSLEDIFVQLTTSETDIDNDSDPKSQTKPLNSVTENEKSA